MSLGDSRIYYLVCHSCVDINLFHSLNSVCCDESISSKMMIINGESWTVVDRNSLVQTASLILAQLLPKIVKM